MRLEKGHMIVGQDTDGLTGAFSAGLGWLVKLDKADFVGKPELAFEYEQWPSACSWSPCSRSTRLSCRRRGASS